MERVVYMDYENYKINFNQKAMLDYLLEDEYNRYVRMSPFEVLYNLGCLASGFIPFRMNEMSDEQQMDVLHIYLQERIKKVKISEMFGLDDRLSLHVYNHMDRMTEEEYLNTLQEQLCLEGEELRIAANSNYEPAQIYIRGDRTNELLLATGWRLKAGTVNHYIKITPEMNMNYVLKQ